MAKDSNVNFKITLDTRSVAKDGTYPLKLYISFNRKTVRKSLKDIVSHYQNNMAKENENIKLRTNFTIEEFEYILSDSNKDFTTIKKRDKIEHKKFLADLELKAQNVINKMKEFSYAQFDSLFFGEKTSNALIKDNVVYQYIQYIKSFSDNQVQSKELYFLSLKKIYKHIKKKDLGPKGFNCDKLLSQDYICPHFSFFEISKDVLEEMKSDTNLGISVTTLGIYFRNLRSIFNSAISINAIPKEAFPFYHKKDNPNGFKIPLANHNKKNLPDDILFKLKEVELSYSPANQRARDFWFLSFYLNGLNINDILQIKFGNMMQGGFIEVVRNKTKYSTAEQKTILISIVPQADVIIKKYMVKSDLTANEYIFPFLKPLDSPDETKKKIKLFIRTVNKGIARITKDLGIDLDIKSYHARYSFSNVAKNKGASMEFISEALGHSTLNTTKLYLDSFKDEKIKSTTKTIFEDFT